MVIYYMFQLRKLQNRFINRIERVAGVVESMSVAHIVSKRQSAARADTGRAVRWHDNARLAEAAADARRHLACDAVRCDDAQRTAHRQ